MSDELPKKVSSVPPAVTDELPKKVLSVPPPVTDEIDSEWGGKSADDTGKANTGTGANQDIDVFGRVTAGQNVPTGSYADTVVATITF